MENSPPSYVTHIFECTPLRNLDGPAENIRRFYRDSLEGVINNNPEEMCDITLGDLKSDDPASPRFSVSGPPEVIESFGREAQELGMGTMMPGDARQEFDPDELG